jgi:hypothetical protein
MLKQGYQPTELPPHHGEPAGDCGLFAIPRALGRSQESASSGRARCRCGVPWFGFGTIHGGARSHGHDPKERDRCPTLASALVALSCVPRTCLHLLSVIDEQLRVSRVKFSNLAFNNIDRSGGRRSRNRYRCPQMLSVSDMPARLGHSTAERRPLG